MSMLPDHLKTRLFLVSVSGVNAVLEEMLQPSPCFITQQTGFGNKKTTSMQVLLRVAYARLIPNTLILSSRRGNLCVDLPSL